MGRPQTWHCLWIREQRFGCVSWRQRGRFSRYALRMCDMTHVYVWHDSSVCVTWLKCMWDMVVTHTVCGFKSYVSDVPVDDREGGFRGTRCVCVIWRMCTSGMTHVCVWHDSVCATLSWYTPSVDLRVTFRMCRLTDEGEIFDLRAVYVGPDACVRVTWLICMCDIVVTHTGCGFVPRHTLSVVLRFTVRMCQLTTEGETFEVRAVYVWPHACVRVAWPLCVCDMTPYVWHCRDTHCRWIWELRFWCVIWWCVR